MDPQIAAERISALFADGGAKILAEAGFGNSFLPLVAQLPEDWLWVDDDDNAGATLFGWLREWLTQQGQIRAAMVFTRELMRRRAAELGQDHPDTLVEVCAMGTLFDYAGRPDDARKLLERAYQGLRSAATGRDPRLAVACENLASHLLRVGQDPLRAEQLFEQSLRIRDDIDPTSTGQVAAQIAELMTQREAYYESIPFWVQALDRYQASFGAGDERTIARAESLIQVYQRLGRDTDTIPVLRTLYQGAVARKDAEFRADTAFRLGCALETAGFTDESYRLVNESVSWTRNQTDHDALASRITTWARMMMKRGRPVEAEGLLLEALEIDRHTFGDDSPEVALRYAHLGNLYAQTGRRDEALGFLEPAAKLLRSTLGDSAYQTRFAVELLVELWLLIAEDAISERDHGYAREVLMEAKQLTIDVLGPKHRLLELIAKHHLA